MFNLLTGSIGWFKPENGIHLPPVGINESYYLRLLLNYLLLRG